MGRFRTSDGDHNHVRIPEATARQRIDANRSLQVVTQQQAYDIGLLPMPNLPEVELLSGDESYIPTVGFTSYGLEGIVFDDNTEYFYAFSRAGQFGSTRHVVRSRYGDVWELVASNLPSVTEWRAIVPTKTGRFFLVSNSLLGLYNTTDWVTYNQPYSVNLNVPTYPVIAYSWLHDFVYIGTTSTSVRRIEASTGNLSGSISPGFTPRLIVADHHNTAFPAVVITGFDTSDKYVYSSDGTSFTLEAAFTPGTPGVNDESGPSSMQRSATNGTHLIAAVNDAGDISRFDNTGALVDNAKVLTGSIIVDANTVIYNGTQFMAFVNWGNFALTAGAGWTCWLSSDGSTWAGDTTWLYGYPVQIGDIGRYPVSGGDDVVAVIPDPTAVMRRHGPGLASTGLVQISRITTNPLTRIGNDLWTASPHRILTAPLSTGILSELPFPTLMRQTRDVIEVGSLLVAGGTRYNFGSAADPKSAVKSADGGATWSAIPDVGTVAVSAGGSSQWFGASDGDKGFFSVLDTSTGVATAFKTVDGGATWSAVTLPAFSSISLSSYTGSRFQSYDNVLFITSTNTGAAGTFAVSTDFGDSWTLPTLPGGATVVQNVLSFNGLFYVCIPNLKTVYTTTDFVTFTPVKTTANTMYGLYRTDNYLVLLTSDVNNQLEYSDDGSSWETLDALTGVIAPFTWAIPRSTELIVGHNTSRHLTARITNM